MAQTIVLNVFISVSDGFFRMFVGGSQQAEDL